MKRWFYIGFLSFSVFLVPILLYWPPAQILAPEIPVSSSRVLYPLNFPFSVGIMLLLSLISYCYSFEDIKSPSSNRQSNPWSWIGFVFWLCAVFGSGTTVVVVGSTWWNSYFLLFVLAGLVSQGVMGFSSMTYEWLREFESEWLRLDVRSIFYALKRGVVRYFNFFPLLLLAAIVNIYTIEWLGLSKRLPGTINLFYSADSVVQFIILGGLITIVAPVAEELFFRGTLYRIVRESLTPYVSAVVSSLVFTSVHREVMWILPISVLGYILAREYENTGRILVPIVIHSVQNSLSFVLLLFAM